MTAQSKVTKGYIKTENIIFIIFVCLALGFVGGVAFSAFRSSSVPVDRHNHSVPESAMTLEQKRTLEALLQAVESSPNDVNLLTRLGHLYFDIGQHENAVAAYEKSLVLDGKRPDVWTDLGVMYRRTGNSDKAIESFNRAISLNQGHEIARFNKGVVFMHDKNDPKAALKAWDDLLRINPDAKAPNGKPIKLMVEELKK